MNMRTFGVLLLAVGLVVPAAGAATTLQANSPVVPTDGEHADDDETEYTRLYVDDRHHRFRLKPGERDSVTVTVENGEDEPVELSPHVHVPPRGGRPIDEDWVTVEGDDAALDAGEKREFEISVAVPDDAELNRYGGAVAFTDETVAYPGRPEQPVHAVGLSVEVWQEPTVLVRSDRHAYTQVKAGGSFTREIVVENTGDGAVPVNPQVTTDGHRSPAATGRETLGRSWLSVDAPSEIGPGETETIAVTVSPPADAERGDYRAELDLGIRDPARADDDTYWQRIPLRFLVWTQPDAPFETAFEVTEGTESIVLDLSVSRRPRGTERSNPARFDVTFVAPDGTEVDAERVRRTTSGSVDLAGGHRRPTADDSTYAAGPERQAFRYRIETPGAGTWSVRITPKNAMQFGYEIVRDEGD